MANKWLLEHTKVEKDFLLFLNKKTPNFILKGGTALALCYGLTRFSVDIDLDGRNISNSGPDKIGGLVQEFCNKFNYKCNLKKDTDLVERWMIDYGHESHKLKVEASYRNINSKDDEIEQRNSIRVFSINDLALMKCNAITERTKIRDFYDICFIANKYWEELERSTKKVIRNLFEYKNFEYAQFLVDTQKDELIDSNKLFNNFLDAYEKVGLEKTEQEKSILKKNFENDQTTINLGEAANIIVNCFEEAYGEPSFQSKEIGQGIEAFKWDFPCEFKGTDAVLRVIYAPDLEEERLCIRVVPKAQEDEKDYPKVLFYSPDNALKTCLDNNAGITPVWFLDNCRAKGEGRPQEVKILMNKRATELFSERKPEQNKEVQNMRMIR